ncbi:MAG: imidazolonepropionase [Crocinitomicaceae bacterium]|nr:imidazolonepropionase [Crocinitomicaceae bacterium]|tara:strand:+ start:55403 stop:56638 length:1236 start_codon:yes stop_codon:yes gene_type:complete
MSKILIKNIKGLVQCGENLPKIRKGDEMKELPILENAFLAIEDGVIVSYGKMKECSGVTDWRDLEVIDAEGKFVLPAFCDSHTHTVFAKSREEEFVHRINGLSYEDIASNGGGILNSAARLQEMSEDELFNSSMKRIDQLKSYGTGALEIKSGYGLTIESELKMLRVIKRLKAESDIIIKSTFLGAHAYPLKFKENHKGYIDQIINEMLPKINQEGLADYIDVFCERNYFSVDDMSQILDAGINYGLRPKVHVNQFSSIGGVRKAVEKNALSVDHMEEISNDDICALQGTSTIVTILPSCSYFLSIPYSNARRLIQNDIPIALASDFNPGSTPSGNLSFVWSLACIKMKMTPEEALNALTLNAAYAMDLPDTHGTISIGKKTPIIITKKIPSLAYIPYSFGEQNIERLIVK